VTTGEILLIEDNPLASSIPGGHAAQRVGVVTSAKLAASNRAGLPSVTGRGHLVAAR